ncbi:hypothetical protein MCUN1_000610 [Malassezia cuniculi]|uniref:Uncharacterized protein n=1 Tax=Malassezia cuniculi TaxID=948313 RepID=A0AAF0ESW8_9BASI|nr:hypothetical protein MCUN1_000610 [Malassezia cuniculi]
MPVNASPGPPPRLPTPVRQPSFGTPPARLPRASPRASLTPDLDKEIGALRAQRRDDLRAFYLVTDKNGGSTSIPPYFALKSALMELSDAEVELDAARARAESVEESLLRIQEDAFTFTAAAAAAET